MSWWDTDIVARETVYYYADVETGVEGWIIRWDSGWGYPAVESPDSEVVKPANCYQWAIDAAFSPDATAEVKLQQRQHALLQLQHVAYRDGFGYLWLPPLGTIPAHYMRQGASQQYVKLVARPD